MSAETEAKRIADYEAARAEVSAKQEAVVASKRRCEWALAGSLRDLQKYTQATPISLDQLVPTLTLALVVANELRDIMKSYDEIFDAPY